MIRELFVLYIQVNRVHYVDRKHILIDGHYGLGRCLIYESLDLAPVEQHYLQMNGRLSLFTFVSAQGKKRNAYKQDLLV